MHQLIYVDGTDAKIGVPYEHVFADGRRALVTMEMWSQGVEVADNSELAEAKKGLRAGLDKARQSLWQQAGGIGAVEFRLRPDTVIARYGEYLDGLMYVNVDVFWTRRCDRLRWNMVFGFAMPDSSAPTRVDYSSITREIAND